jgi:acyl-CoA hydrolase
MTALTPKRDGRRLAIGEAVALIQPRDTVLCGFAAGQPVGLLEALGARRDLEEIVLFTGLLIRPYALLQHPGVRVVSGFFGPIDRAARAAGASIEYLPADFHGLERLALRMRPRVVLAVTTPPDAEGWLSFGVTAGASYRAFVEAARDPARLALAEVNPRVPRIGGIAELGGNRVHVSEIDGWVEHEEDLVALPVPEASPEEIAIAAHVTALIEDGSTLQFGIGAIPDEIARRLATGPLGDFGIHTEMIADGVMHLHQAGKVTNQKGLYDGITVGTFALG